MAKNKKKTYHVTEAELKKIRNEAKRIVYRKTIDASLLLFVTSLLDEFPKMTDSDAVNVIRRAERYSSYLEPYGEQAEHAKIRLQDVAEMLKEKHGFEISIISNYR